MGIQYLTDDEGNKVAVVIPLKEWEAMQQESMVDDEPLSPQTLAAIEQENYALADGDSSQFVSWEDYKRERGGA